MNDPSSAFLLANNSTSSLAMNALQAAVEGSKSTYYPYSNFPTMTSSRATSAVTGQNNATPFGINDILSSRPLVVSNRFCFCLHHTVKF